MTVLCLCEKDKQKKEKKTQGFLVVAVVFVCLFVCLFVLMLTQGGQKENENDLTKSSNLVLELYLVCVFSDDIQNQIM